jgi:peroxiredoxin 2/4
MTAYQAGIAKFVDAGAKVFGISTDNVPSLRRFAEDLKLQFPLLSDFMRGVSRQYGVLIEDRGMANRTTFVVAPDGRIEHIEEGSSAVDVTGAETACRRIRQK